MTRSDAQLVDATLHGDRQAFGDIVARYQTLVASIAYSGTGDLALSQDLAQETFLVAWKGLGGLREPGKLKAWLSGIARNLSRGAARRIRPGSRSHGDDPETLAAAGPGGSSPLDQVLAAEEQRLLWSALEAIPGEYREPLVLFYREQQSVAAVAETLDLSQDAVKQRLSRGRRMLKAQVAGFVEAALARTRPGRAFTVAVLAALPAGSAAPAAAASAGASGLAKASSAGLSGALGGSAIGLLGAWVGVRASIVNTRSARERAFMVRVAWSSVAYVGVLLVVEGAAWLLAPGLIRSAAWHVGVAVLYVAGLVALIVRTNRRQRQIQIEDGTWPAPAPAPSPAAEARNIRGSLAGGVFGSLLWLWLMAGIARDWTALALLVAATLTLYELGCRAALRQPAAYFQVARRLLLWLGALGLAVILLRWDAWLVVYRVSRIYDASSDRPAWQVALLWSGMLALLWLLFRAQERRAPPR
jgi:RNA polymerase sigma factor (sigma-70 family)